MNYQVPRNIDPNKIFLVNRSETKGRLDPKMALYNKRVQNSLFPMVKLKNLLLSKPQYGANESGLDRLNNTQPRYIRITDIDENGLISINELGATVAKVEEKYILSNNDILIARSGATVGKAYLHKELPYTCLYAGYLIRFLVDPSIILPGFLFSYTQLNSYKEWVSAIQRPSAQPNINAEEYQSLEIPLPDLPTQKAIVEIINQAYLEKQLKEEEANAILKSIDDYLLGELGIGLPEMESQTLQNRIYIVSRSVLEDRLDPYYSQEYFRNAFEVLGLCKYPVVNLKEISKLITSGITPKSGGDAYTEDKSIGIPFVRSGNISIDGELNYDDLLYLKPEIHENVMNSSKLKKDDILIAIVGATIGQVGIYLSEGEANINQAIALVRLKEGYNVQFVKELIKSSIGQLSLNRLKRPVARANINLEEISRIKVVLPPKEKQEEIVAHISEMRARAKKLQAEGAEVLQKAKMEVERMILG
jgi:restriction endonuclease S subunit